MPNGGRMINAASIFPASRSSIKRIDTPGATWTRIIGWAARNFSSARASRVGCADAIAPMRSRPLMGVSSGTSPSREYSEQISSARPRVVWPLVLSVADRPVLSKSSNPNVCSSRLIWLLTADCVRPIASPAAANVPCLQTAMKVLSSLINDCLPHVSTNLCDYPGHTGSAAVRLRIQTCTSPALMPSKRKRRW